MNEKPLRLTENVDRGRPVRFTFDGEAIEAYEGETVAAALMAAGRRVFRRTQAEQHPRGIFCGIGLCFDCVVTVDGLEHVRACITPVREGMQVTTPKL